MSEELAGVERERQMLIDAESQGTGAKFKAYVRLSGPGWLQSAITLGGGSLASSLFLGILAGYHLLWLQIFAMICGVTMLGAIGYVALSTGERPFKLINERINPVLGWGWALATLAANIVWCLPQFSLAEAAVSQNLAPGLADMKWLTCGVILAIGIGVTSLYGSGGKGLRLYENLLRILVAFIVLSFFGVVITLLAKGGIAVGDIFAGLVPSLSMFNNPSPQVAPLVEAAGEYSEYWHNLIVAKQRDVMVSAAATAVGINMTFLFPYSLLKKNWDRNFRGLSLFDLATGMAIPFVLATGCVVIAAGSSFHGKPSQEIVENWPDNPSAIDGKLKGDFEKLLAGRLKASGATPSADKAELLEQLKALPEADRNIAATIANRNSLVLAKALAPLTGDFVANYVFGFGVLAMALSTITILMLISGFTFCEVLGLPQEGIAHRIGTLLPAVGVLGPFYWKSAAAYLAVPTSVFGMALLPIAYFTFFILMNSKNALGNDLPQGGKRMAWNIMMAIACGFSTVGAGWAVWSKVQWKGVGAFAAFIALAVVVHFVRPPKTEAVESSEQSE